MAELFLRTLVAAYWKSRTYIFWQHDVPQIIKSEDNIWRP